ncbi:MAG: hypothetical protein IKM85_02065 [Bacteroidales bacterium]|nr:hypothetical protein [Bacteroidales bacterium]
MKKLLIIITILLGLSFGAFAQGGLFQYGAVSDEEYCGASSRDGSTPLLSLPGTHGETNDVQAPLSDGALLLVGLGAAYLVGKKRNEK